MTHDTATHVHDPDPPQTWTAAEDDTLRRMKAEGAETKLIATAMDRTERSVAGRWAYLNLTPSQRAQRNAREASRKASEREARKAEAREYLRKHQKTTHLAARCGKVESESRIVPEQVFAERNARQMAPRSLTAVLCGDPAPGWSALDRKQGAMA
jgi:hypothetical protein